MPLEERTRDAFAPRHPSLQKCPNGHRDSYGRYNQSQNGNQSLEHRAFALEIGRTIHTIFGYIPACRLRIEKTDPVGPGLSLPSNYPDRVYISHSLYSTDPIELSDMLSKKARHAFRALFALANHGSSAPMMIADIAEQASVPRKFLEQILLDLKRTGIVTSYRGKYGGYSLGRSPESITFAEVIRTIDGPLALTPCVSATAYQRCGDCLDEKGCAIRKVLLAVRNATAVILEDHSLADAYALKPAKRRNSG